MDQTPYTVWSLLHNLWMNKILSSLWLKISDQFRIPINWFPMIHAGNCLAPVAHHPCWNHQWWCHFPGELLGAKINRRLTRKKFIKHFSISGSACIDAIPMVLMVCLCNGNIVRYMLFFPLVILSHHQKSERKTYTQVCRGKGNDNYELRKYFNHEWK